jgi:peptidoglycan hydrolase-like protein with peptidoglycan-binding domain
MQAVARLVGRLMVLLMLGGVAQAQTPSGDASYVRIEARPTLAEAEARARAYGAVFPDVLGFRLETRWYGIALGPYTAAQAADRLAELRRENLIPADSYLSDGSNFRGQFWPVGAPPAPPLPTPLAATEAVPEPTAPVEAAPLAPAAVDETPAEARQSEAALTPAQREDLQRALQWDGFYAAAIDGAFGPGTRRSMAAWQAAMGMDPTGVLTTRQRETLVANWQADVAEYGLQTVSEPEAGIEITLPLGLVQFDHYEPPFVHFVPKTSGGMRVILISQPGDQEALYGLYDILQTLTIMPTTGERSRDERSFQIIGTSASLQSHAFAETRAGLVKGYILVWSPDQADRAQRVLGQMQASFRPIGNRALDPGMVPMADTTRRGLLSGLEVRRPKLSASGFFIDASGRVLTSAETVAQCGRITLDGVTDATVQFRDAATGLAVLTPARAMAPPAVAAFQQAPDRIGAEVAVAGYAYGDALPAPVISFGVLEDVQGLAGEAGLKRLSIATLPGDVGGPVLDATGAVLGMLLPRAAGDARVLPEGVAFAASGAAVTTALRAQGLDVTASAAAGALAPEDLSRKASGMTVLVGCWD